MALACGQCGAPDDGEFVHCRYCKQPVSQEAAQYAIPCPNPQCRQACRWGKQKCAACQAWLVVSCVFCGALSPHNQSNCLSCREAFQGAAQRKQQREMAARQQQQQQQQAQYGGGGGDMITGVVLGGLAGAALGSAFGGHEEHVTGGDYVADYSGETDYSGGSSDDYSGSSDGDFGGGISDAIDGDWE